MCACAGLGSLRTWPASIRKRWTARSSQLAADSCTAVSLSATCAIAALSRLPSNIRIIAVIIGRTRYLSDKLIHRVRSVRQYLDGYFLFLFEWYPLLEASVRRESSCVTAAESADTSSARATTFFSAILVLRYLNRLSSSAAWWASQQLR
jgi:hypothetical protein